MREVSIGARRYQLTALQRDTSWTAHAVLLDTGERFGVECAGATEDAALDRLARWLVWQDAHDQALKVLQEAERVYHRVVTRQAFAPADEDEATRSACREALAAIESARIRLDSLRAGRSED